MKYFFYSVTLLIIILCTQDMMGQNRIKTLEKAEELNKSRKFEETLRITREQLKKDSASAEYQDMLHAKLYFANAEAHTGLTQYTDASIIYRNALDAGRKSKDTDHKLLADMIIRVGEFYLKHQYFGQAEEQARQAFVTVDTLKNRNLKDISDILYKGGWILWKSGSLAESENWYQRILLTRDSLQETPEKTLHPSVRIACIQVARGKYKSAESLFAELMPRMLKTSGLNDEVYREALFAQARLLAETGKRNEALIKLTDLLSLLKVHEPNYVEASRLTEELYAQKGEFKPALDLAERVFFEYQKTIADNPELYVYAYANLLNLYHASGDSASAEKYYEEASVSTRQSFGQSHTAYAWILGEKGMLLLRIGRFKDAMTHLNKSAQIWSDKAGSKSLPYARSLYQLGYANAYIGKYNKAQPYFLRALEIMKLHLDPCHPMYCEALDKTADLYMLVARYDEAEKYLLPLIETIKNRNQNADEDNYDLTYAYIRAGKLYGLTGEYFKADSLFNLAIEAGKTLKGYNKYYQAIAYYEKGWMHHQKGSYAESLEDLNQAEKYFLDMPFRGKMPDIFMKRNMIGYAQNLTRRGSVLISCGRFYEAGKYFPQALDLFKAYQGEDFIPFAEAMAGLAELNFHTGYYSVAERQSIRAKEIMSYVAGEFHPSFGEALMIHADILLALGRNEEARRLLEQALVITKDRLGDNHPLYAHQQSDLAYIFLLENKTDSAEHQLRQAAAILSKNKAADIRLLTQNDIRLAMVLTERKSYTAAYVLLMQALARVNKTPEYNEPMMARIQFDMAQVFMAQNNWAEAERYFTACDEIQQKILPSKHPDHHITRINLAWACWKQGKITEADEKFTSGLDAYLKLIENVFPGMSDQEKTRTWNRVQPYIQMYGHFATEVHESHPQVIPRLLNYQLEAKGILLNGSALLKAKVLNSGNPEMISSYEKWADINGQIARINCTTSRQTQIEGISPARLQDELTKIEKDLGQKTELLDKLISKNPADWKLIQKNLKTDEAAVEILKLENISNTGDSTRYIGIVILSGNTLPLLVHLGNTEQLESASLINYRRSIQNQQADPYSYTTYWEPLTQPLTGINRIFLCPDGVYHFINPETFQGPDGKYLSDQFQIIRVNNLREIRNLDPALIASRQGSGNKTAMIIGNPDFYLDKNTLMRTSSLEAFPELPGTEEEVKHIQKLLNEHNWKCTVLSGGEATETAVCSAKSPGILHVATHGYFISNVNFKAGKNFMGLDGAYLARNPMLRSGLLLTGSGSVIQGIQTSSGDKDDGVLTALEVMTMNLSGTDLVVLSACESGLGEIISGEGILGLQRGFRIAGAKSVIMTLWNVSDDITSEVMTYFYKYFLNGQSQSEALRNTLTEIRKKHPDPKDWGAYVLNGI